MFYQHIWKYQRTQQIRMYGITRSFASGPMDLPEHSDEVRNAIQLLISKGFEVFHSPFVNVAGYIENMEHDLAGYRRRDEAEREEAKRKEEARKKRQANKEKREAAAAAAASGK